MNWTVAGILGFLCFGGFCALLVGINEYDKRKQRNVRVPHETLWTRTNRYHEGK